MIMSMCLNRDYWLGYHACERDEPFNPNETQDWQQGYKDAIKMGAYKPQ